MQVQRLHLSSYYGEEFIQKEREAVESLGFQYLFDPQISNDTNIIISTSQVEWENYSKEQLESLNLIIHPNSGYDNFSFDIFKDLKVPVILGNNIRAQAVAEYSLACLYQHFCPIPFSKVWDPSRAFPKRKLLKNCSILLYGFGHVGKIIAESLLSLDAKVFIQDPYLDMNLELENRQFDAIVMACSLNKYNHQMIDKKVLSQIEPTGCFINAARGKLVNLVDLFEFLNQNKKSTAYLDVTPKEPFNTEQFTQIENIKLTSHISGVSSELNEMALSFVKKTLRNFKEGIHPTEQTLSFRQREDYFI